MIRLYDAAETAFSTNGLGVLADAISCEVSEERNGGFELVMEYPIDGVLFDGIQNRNIIYCKPSPGGNYQPFRIYRITRPIGGVVTVYAQHISYDLNGIVDSAFSAMNVKDVMPLLKSKAITSCPFTFSTDKNTMGDFSISVPTGIRSIMGGIEGSILDIYGGEYEYDGFNVYLRDARGLNRGATIRYGKNLTDLTQEENIQSVYTGVCPYWVSSEEGGGVVTLSEGVVNAPGSFDYVKILPVDFSSDFEEQPSQQQLRTAATNYITLNNIGTPEVSLEVSFIQLGQSEDYKDIAPLEEVNLCDTVNVYFPRLGVNASAKCVSTTYNAITDRYISVTLGSMRSNIADTIVQQQYDISAGADGVSTDVQAAINRAIEAATAAITGADGGYVVFHDSDSDGQPDEILIMNTPDITTSTKVWRWNSGGLGYSSNGYNGPYGTAITMDGLISGAYIATGTLVANKITSGTLDASRVTIKNLNADNITAGQITANHIVDLSASKITSGTFSESRIPDISANKLTAGTIDADEINIINLNASSITSGKISAQYIDTDGLSVSEIRLGSAYMSCDRSGCSIYGPSYITLGAPGSGVSITGSLSCNGTIYAEGIPNGLVSSGNITAYNHQIAAYSAIFDGWCYSPDWTNGSDQKLKKDIDYNVSESFCDLIKNLKPVSYKYIDDKNEKLRFGFIAQDVQSALETVGYKDTGALVTAAKLNTRDVDDTLTLSYTDIVAPLVAMVQKMQTEIEELKGMINNG